MRQLCRRLGDGHPGAVKRHGKQCHTPSLAHGCCRRVRAALHLGRRAYSFYRDNRQQKKWRRVEAKIIRSGLTETRRNVTKKYMLDVRYAYWVNGWRYESESIGVVTYYTSRSEAQGKADEYRLGSAVIALVNPDHPEEALLEWGHSGWAITLAFFLGLAWLAGWYSTYLGPYLRRHEWIR